MHPCGLRDCGISEARGEMLRQVVKVEKEALAACMTCPLCNKLFTDATTISECLHTFCRNCIYEKIYDEELDSCPICYTELGCAPMEKLRADHSLQDLRAKIFPYRRQNPTASCAVSSVREAAYSAPIPCRRKERSLSSLVISTPKVSAKAVLTGKRSKFTRKNLLLQESINPVEEIIEKVDDHHENLSSPDTPRNSAQARRQGFSIIESSKQHMPYTENGAKSCEEKTNLWKPLSCLVEAASNSKPNKSNLQDTLLQVELPDVEENQARHCINNVQEHGNKSKVNSDEHNFTASASGSVKPRRLQGGRQKRAAISEDLNIPAQYVVDANSNYDGGTFKPIWFSLVASDEQEGGAPLPQISSCYLRVKDGNLPVSTIKRYLVKKLGLASESEVEIFLRGAPLISALHLHNLVEWWLETAPTSERIQAMVGSSAKDFVMVLTYGRKAYPP